MPKIRIVSKAPVRMGIGFAIGALLLGRITAPSQTMAASSASAPTFTVNSLEDVVASAPLDNGVCETAPGNHTCTLRAAIMKANHYPNGGVTIIMPAGAYDLTIAPTPADYETSGDLNINESLTLIGAGASVTIIDAHQIDRVFNIKLGKTVTISNVTIRNGLVNGTGGGLQNSGTLTLNNDVISGNQTMGGSAGGGIANLAGALTLNNTVVNSNQAYGNAGGVYNNNNSSLVLNNSIVSGNQTSNGGYGGGLGNAGTLTMNSSLISGNQASGKGGGIANFAGALSQLNCTISNNSAVGDGGGIYNTATLNANFTTISGNLADSGATSAAFGGGIYNGSSSTISLKASLLGMNFASAAPSDGDGVFNSQDYNLIQTTVNITLTGITTHDMTGVDPLLDSTGMNGGPTPTRALFAGSPAVDAIPTDHCTDQFGAPLASDGRDFPRPVNGACDIGAFEGQQPVIGFLRNLVRNGDAEAAAGSPGGAFVAVPFWQTGGQLMTAVPYNTPGGFPSVFTDTVPANHGDNFFAGGISLAAGGTQIIDLSLLAPGIDAGVMSYTFSADLGGYLSQDDNATVEADFLDGTSQLLTQVILGPVTAADRGNLTGILHRQAIAPVPVGTRTVEVFIIMNTVEGPYNDGYVDNVALVLRSQEAVFLPLLIR